MAMPEELNQFERSKVWNLEPSPSGCEEDRKSSPICPFTNNPIVPSSSKHGPSNSPPSQNPSLSGASQIEQMPLTEGETYHLPILPIPLTPLDITRKFSGNPIRFSNFKIPKKSMTAYYKLLFSFVIKNLIPHQERMDAASYLDLTLIELLDRKIRINLPDLMMSYITKVANDIK
ncbi:hypothetical protein HAX54_019628 [Datura stramonium]|uniref:Uncharacterized protein n=1 Tax=Datura stramonium TaxID=4076 RepID=A0ABS8URJ1_DATST|nr:hypothetical protein [Datura stramonium]